MRSPTYRSISAALLFVFAGFMTYRSVVTGIQLHRVIQYSPESGLVGYAHVLSLLLHVLLVSISILLIAAIYRYERIKKQEHF